MSSIILYGASGSPFVTKVQIVLAEKGIDYESVPTAPVTKPLPPGTPFTWITPELSPHTPLGKIPFMRMGDRWLADSSVIAAFLERLYPDPAMYPSDPWDYARALWYEEFVDGGAYPKLFSTIFFERLLAPQLLGRPTDQAVVDRAIAEDMPIVYGYLDKEIGSKAYLVAGRFTIADAAAAAFFASMQMANAAPDRERWPNLARYVEGQHTRPTIARLIKQASSPTGRRSA
jgi:glutathione S-transferase